MGGISSRFRKAIQTGDQTLALQIYNSSRDLRENLDPNLSYGENHGNNTAMHYVSLYGQKVLIRVFLDFHNGNPNKRNANSLTSLHEACICANSNDPDVQVDRAECVQMLLAWQGPPLGNGRYERVDVATTDAYGNSALHYASLSGLKKCVELIVAHGAPLFQENKDGHTPCDCAAIHRHADIAALLESKMVFAAAENEDPEVSDGIYTIKRDESYSGLRSQELQEAKDSLLIETADMLHVPLFTAEALLRNNVWSKEMLLEGWMRDPVACCEKAGVKPPDSVLAELGKKEEGTAEDAEQRDRADSETLCDICTGPVSSDDEPVDIPCAHQFCQECWERYLSLKIKDGSTGDIQCPGYECSQLVPVETIEKLVPREMAMRYQQFDIKAFVETNPHIKWCPFPGCGRAVRLPSESGTAPIGAEAQTSHAVDCGNGHFFCWECLGEVHEPSSCDQWKQWQQKITEIDPSTLSPGSHVPEKKTVVDTEAETTANCLWLVTNTKPCPKCKVYIQKNEGCNHMKCTKCKYDFCWVCLEDWEKHSSSTGGYFRCNRYEVVQKVEEETKLLTEEAREKNEKAQELSRLMHYYTRFKNHDNSFRIEEAYLRTAMRKMNDLALAAASTVGNQRVSTRFVEEAIRELLSARRVLKFSYCYGYYVGDARKRRIFEDIQTELEEATETLSQMIARPYLRTPRSKIIQGAQLTQRKRHDFLAAVEKGLLPPETPPSERRRILMDLFRPRFFEEEDEESLQDEDAALAQAILASLRDAFPQEPPTPPQGDSSTQSSDEPSPNPATRLASTGASPTRVPPVDPTLCLRIGCGRPRAVHRQSGRPHDFCSLRCLQMARRRGRRGRNSLDLPWHLLELEPPPTPPRRTDSLPPLPPTPPQLRQLCQRPEESEDSDYEHLTVGRGDGGSQVNPLTSTLQRDLPASEQALFQIPTEDGTLGAEPGVTDPDLHRVLELSRLSAQLAPTESAAGDQGEDELIRAIELSLQLSTTNSSTARPLLPQVPLPVQSDSVPSTNTNMSNHSNNNNSIPSSGPVLVAPTPQQTVPSTEKHVPNIPEEVVDGVQSESTLVEDVPEAGWVSVPLSGDTLGATASPGAEKKSCKGSDSPRRKSRKGEPKVVLVSPAEVEPQKQPSASTSKMKVEEAEWLEVGERTEFLEATLRAWLTDEGWLGRNTPGNPAAGQNTAPKDVAAKVDGMSPKAEATVAAEEGLEFLCSVPDNGNANTATGAGEELSDFPTPPAEVKSLIWEPPSDEPETEPGSLLAMDSHTLYNLAEIDSIVINSVQRAEAVSGDPAGEETTELIGAVGLGESSLKSVQNSNPSSTKEAAKELELKFEDDPTTPKDYLETNLDSPFELTDDLQALCAKLPLSREFPRIPAADEIWIPQERVPEPFVFDTALTPQAVPSSNANNTGAMNVKVESEGSPGLVGDNKDTVVPNMFAHVPVQGPTTSLSAAITDAHQALFGNTIAFPGGQESVPSHPVLPASRLSVGPPSQHPQITNTRHPATGRHQSGGKSPTFGQKVPEPPPRLTRERRLALEAASKAQSIWERREKDASASSDTGDQRRGHRRKSKNRKRSKEEGRGNEGRRRASVEGARGVGEGWYDPLDDDDIPATLV
ncbi:ANKIB1 [Branchiostoma lanceolatum]|uniref:RBR-type E3 ubiquitin transferase n=1 Tax=Branchiostoma lanceolatum TaxID=7740 RepID=A0A8J9Z925_BRALA|nr:ANKIB1 [Branchiostoma lanceolatum]